MNNQVMALMGSGFNAHQQGRLNEAARCYEQVLSVYPQHIDALYLFGLLKMQSGELPNAATFLARAVDLNPRHVDAQLHLGATLAQLGRTNEAVACFSHAQKLDPKNPTAFFNMGLAYAGLGDYENAIAQLQNAIALHPAFIEAINNLGNVYQRVQRYEDAVACFQRALSLAPDYPNALLGLSAALSKLERYEAALEPINKLLQLVPNSPEAYDNKGVILAGLEAHEAAIAEYGKALQLNPNASEVYVKLGVAYLALKRFDEAFAAYREALALNPESSDAYMGLGTLHMALKQYPETLSAYQKSLALNPNNAEAYTNLGVVHMALKQYVEALAAFQKALALKPDSSDVYNNLGNLHSNLGQHGEAVAAFEKALALKPDNSDAYNNLGNLYCDLRQYAEAVAAFEKALVLKPAYSWLQGMLLHTQMRLCDWRNFQQSADMLLSQIAHNEKVSPPFELLSWSSSSRTQRVCAEVYTRDACPSVSRTVNSEYPHHRIRVGYLSCDFRKHAVSWLMSGVIEAHDRTRFEIHGIDIGVDDQSDTRKRLGDAFDEMHGANHLSDEEVSNLIRHLEIDVLIDLTGYTKGARTAVLASRPAPVQVNYLGYPGTMGAPFIDYIIGDATLIPPEARDGYSEKIVYLPECFQANDAKREIAQRPSKAGVGLDENAFVFGCFNQCVKFTPSLFSVWLSILKQVPRSILWLVEDSKTQVENLRAFAATQGVSPDRLVFAGKLPYAEHLARYALMDLALDTYPFNGGTTTSDALWGGAPVLTCSGEAMASRMAASLLNAVGLPELVTSSLQAYENLAVDLAMHPAKLATLRERLAKNRLTMPLFDTARFTRHLENAYEQMVSMSRRGLEADHIYVPVINAE